MTSSDLWDADAAARYDEAVADMFEPDVLDPTVDLLAELAGNGPVLEFAVGTGRVALPLAERGIAVTGLEFSHRQPPHPG
ncbi:class I SAM-dependent methyltransferase, partial [Phycicoccus sp.]|uniref:class I SAM-dependent methyltransferase n=1 Tax=Phycicoccus sp. TaxID=1902410 RepID=UPI002C2E2CF5